jgi:hypothetical protein
MTITSSSSQVFCLSKVKCYESHFVSIKLATCIRIRRDQDGYQHHHKVTGTARSGQVPLAEVCHLVPLGFVFLGCLFTPDPNYTRLLPARLLRASTVIEGNVKSHALAPL